MSKNDGERSKGEERERKTREQMTRCSEEGSTCAGNRELERKDHQAPDSMEKHCERSLRPSWAMALT